MDLRTPADLQKAFDLEQTHLIIEPRLAHQAGKPARGTMAIPESDKRKEYARYALYCLNMVAAAPDQESRVIQREMAAEWLKLAKSIRHPPRFTQMQME
jgi:hypothetical protein